jgi:Leucine-rich repeat (LRR) protein
VILQLPVRSLNLSTNQIYSVPDEIDTMTFLGVLYIENNRLVSFPPITHLKNLHALNLGDNRLTRVPVLPPTITLQVLDIDGNSIPQVESDRLTRKYLRR